MRVGGWTEFEYVEETERSRESVQKMLGEHKPEEMPRDVARDLDNVTGRIMKRHGVDTLPPGPSTAISETQTFFYSEGH